MATRDNAVVLSFETSGQVQYAKTIKDINSIMNAAAKEYRAHIKAMGEDASATDKLAAEKKKLQTQLEAGKERTEKLRAEFEKMQGSTKTTTTQLNNMYGKLKDSEAAEASLEQQLDKVNQQLSEQGEESRKNQSELSELQQESKLLASETEKLNSEFDLLESQLGENASESEKAANAQEKFGRQSEIVEKQIQNLEDQLKIVKKEFGENSVEANKMEAELNDAKTAFNNLNGEMRNTSSASDEAQTGLGKLTSVVKSQAMMDAAQELEQISQKIIEIGTNSIETAATYQANQAQFEQVFGEMGSQAKQIAEDMGEEFDMIPSRLTPGLTKMTSMFKGLGVDTQKALSMADDAVRASADAAAFYDVSFESANASLTSFLKGNYEAGESVGVFANDTQMATFAIEKGVVNTTAEWQKLDEATKQATRLEYIQNMQEMAGATGQATRESEGYENQMGNMQAVTDEFMNAIGQEALKMFLETLQTIIPAIQSFTQWFSSLNPEIKEAIVIILGVVAAMGLLLPLFATVGLVISTGMAVPLLILGAIALAIAAIIIAVKNWGTIMDWINEKVGGVISWISEKFDQVKTKANEIRDSIKNAFTGAMDAAKETVSKAIEKITGLFKIEWKLPKIKLPHFGIKPKGWEFGDLLKGKIPTIDIDWRAKGGIFTKPTIFGASNGSLQGAGEAGPEAVIPLNEETLASIGAGIPNQGQVIQNISIGELHANNPSELTRVNRQIEKASRHALGDIGG
ncbi:hypothetical protein [Enterococcus sp. HY326]|uniref:hypothetical protein n=1 Tax=Enterococcus sp. HY326 TaxID=2971265 RepID=UPI0022400446|nr:hypothetical protein [Enterococcus sp. HY326]